jgi:DNA-binding NtrC family response regulator
MLRYPHILLLTNDEGLAREINVLLGEYATLTQVDKVVDLRRVLRATQVDALLCDWSLDSGAWRNAVKDAQNHDSVLPVLALSRTGGEKEWTNVIEAGCFDLLVAPYRKESMLAALEQATASQEARSWHQTTLQAAAS